MGLFSRKSQLRRTNDESSWWEAIGSRRTVIGFAIGLVFLVAALAIIMLPEKPLLIKAGETLARPYYARARFEYELQETTKDARDLAQSRVAGVYTPKMEFLIKVEKAWDELLAACDTAETIEQVPEGMVGAWELDSSSFKAIKKMLGDGSRLESRLAAVVEVFQNLKGPQFLAILPAQQKGVERARTERVDALIKKLGADPDFRREKKYDYLLAEQRHGVTVRFVEGESMVPLTDIFTVEDRDNIGQRVAQVLRATLSRVLDEKILSLLIRRVTKSATATLEYEKVLTDNLRVKEGEIEPILGVQEPGTTVVEAGRPLTTQDVIRLEAENKAYLAGIKWHQTLFAWVGAGILVGLLAVLMTVYSLKFQPNVIHSNARTAVLCLLCLAGLGVARLAQSTGDHFDIVFMVTFAMIITLVYNARFALGATVGLIVLVIMATKATPAYGVEGASETGFTYAATLLAGTGVAIFTLGEVNNRLKPIKVGFYSGLAIGATIFAFAVWHQSFLGWHILWQVMVGFGYGVAAGVLTLALLPFIERLFGITTDISLLELCDVNQPVLRRLAMEAPGTYSHSLLIGNLAEAAAAAIGANGLLARVGAYFHDIGKVNKPKYFSENQQGRMDSGHQMLTPPMSKLIITAHVKDGLEMADKYGLPPAIKQFIAEHHGTTLVEYFYHEAARKHAENGEEAPPESEYRYPGPKPRSKETAIVMLADVVEGQVRSIKEPNAARISTAVREALMKRLMDGQLDESGLTLSEVHKIQDSLTKTLLGVYHTRVPYPSLAEK